MKKTLLIVLLALCQSCQSNEGSSPRIFDDRDVVIHLKLHPQGASKAYAGLATMDPSHAMASSWRRMKIEIDRAQPASQRFLGFRKIGEIPGFGASVVLLPDSYSQAYPWVIICNEPSMYQSPAECTIKGNSGKWTAEVLISTDDVGEFSAIVDSIRSEVPRQ